jgi:hypothetical protein
MNEELRKLVLEAGCPEEVIDTLWFNIFIQKYTCLLLDSAYHFEEWQP